MSPARKPSKGSAFRENVESIAWAVVMMLILRVFLLQAFRIGDVGITAIPFETFAETGLSIKERSPLQPTFNIELANGSYGYLPTPPQHELGGYETWLGTNFVEKEASEKIAATLLELLGEVQE